MKSTKVVPITMVVCAKNIKKNPLRGKHYIVCAKKKKENGFFDDRGKLGGIKQGSPSGMP